MYITQDSIGVHTTCAVRRSLALVCYIRLNRVFVLVSTINVKVKLFDSSGVAFWLAQYSTTVCPVCPLYCATQGRTGMGIAFLYVPYVFWKMGAHRNATPKVKMLLFCVSFWDKAFVFSIRSVGRCTKVSRPV